MDRYKQKILTVQAVFKKTAQYISLLERLLPSAYLAFLPLGFSPVLFCGSGCIVVGFKLKKNNTIQKTKTFQFRLLPLWF